MSKKQKRFSRKSMPKGSAQAELALNALLAGLEDLGFGTDKEINGAEAVDAIAELYEDVTQRLLAND